MSKQKLIRAHCVKALRKYRRNTFSAIVTDPPYGLKFMGKSWDHGVPGVLFWRAFLRVTKPGGMLLAFGGTRTHHRLMCAIEDAGWEIRDCLMWVYGSGFPKSHDLSKAIDKAAGAEREVVGRKSIAYPDSDCWGIPNRNTMDKQFSAPNPMDRANGKGVSPNERNLITAPSTDAAQLWDGWGTALKPAWEPIILAMKPLEGTFAANALEHEVAGINVDGCRIKMEENLNDGTYSPGVGPTLPPGPRGGDPSGRWPANLIFSHSPGCRQVGVRKVKSGTAIRHNKGTTPSVFLAQDDGAKDDLGYADPDGYETCEDWDCYPDCPIGMLDRQSGVSKTSGSYVGNVADTHGICYGRDRAKYGKNVVHIGHGDSGTASRFFYCAKSSKAERTVGGQVENKHPTVKPLKLMEYLCKLVSMPKSNLILDPFCGSGSTLVACKKLELPAVGIDKDPKAILTALHRLKYTERETCKMKRREDDQSENSSEETRQKQKR